MSREKMQGSVEETTGLASKIAWSRETLALVAPVRGQVHTPLPHFSLEEIEAARIKLRPEKTLSDEFKAPKELRAHVKNAHDWLHGVEGVELVEEAMVSVHVLATGPASAVALRWDAMTHGAEAALSHYFDALDYDLSKKMKHNKSYELTGYAYKVEPFTTNARYGMSSSSYFFPDWVEKLPGIAVARQLLTTINASDYEQFASRARTMAQSRGMGKLVLFALFPERTARADLEPLIGAYTWHVNWPLGLIATTDMELIAQAFEKLDFHLNFHEVTFYTWVYLFEEKACSLFALAQEQVADAVIPALSLIEAPEALECFGKLSEQKKVAVTKRALKVMGRFPAVALLGVRPRQSVATQALAAAIVHEHPDALEVAIAHASAPGCRVTLERLRAPDPDALASHEALPAVLRDPPWDRKRSKHVVPAHIKGLTAPSIEATVTIPEDLLAAHRPRWDSMHNFETVEEHDASMVQFISQNVERKERHDHWIRSFNTEYLLNIRQLEVVRQVWARFEQGVFLFSSDHIGHLARFLDRHGSEVLDLACALASQRPEAGIEALRHCSGATVVMYMVDAYCGKKRGRVDAAAWLCEHPESVLSLIPRVFGEDRGERTRAEAAIALLAQHHEHDVLLEIARPHFEVEVLKSFADLLKQDPLERLPKKMAAVPDWLTPAALPTLHTREPAGKIVPNEGVQALLKMLTLANLADSYAGFEQVREAITAESLDALVTRVFRIWEVNGADRKMIWALHAIREFGGDEAARTLAARVRVWGKTAPARAKWGLDVLAAIGSDLALMHIHDISSRVKQKGLKTHAAEVIAQIADARGLTPVELADRLVPTFDLDRRGRLRLDYGPRHFDVGFDEQLSPIIYDEAGKVRKSLPKPAAQDDADMAARAIATFKDLKKDVKAIASQQIARQEHALVTSRRWTGQDFVLFFLEQPLMFNLTHRLLWGRYEGDRLVEPFRVDPSLECFTLDDQKVVLDDATVGLVHPLQLDPAQLVAWREAFIEDEVIQPFEQLAREHFSREASLAFLEHEVVGRSVSTSKLVYGLDKHGWMRAQELFSGCFCWHTYPVQASGQVYLVYDHGVEMGYIEPDDLLTVTQIYLAEKELNSQEPGVFLDTLADVTEVELSEITRSLKASFA